LLSIRIRSVSVCVYTLRFDLVADFLSSKALLRKEV
jgi:hypothetical protein